MDEQVLKNIKISYKEDFGIFKWILYTIFLLFSIFVHQILGYLFILIFISIVTYQITSLNERHGVEPIVACTAIGRENILWAQLITSVISSLPGLIILFVILSSTMHAPLFLSCILSLVTYLYAISLGTFIGKIIKNQILAISMLCIYFALVAGEMKFTTQEVIRYICPILSLNRVTEMYLSNILGLIGFILFFIGITFFIYTRDTKQGKRYSSLFILSFCVLIGLAVYGDFNMNEKIKNLTFEKTDFAEIPIYYRGVGKEDILYLVKVSMSYRNQIEKYHLPVTWEEIICDKRVIFPWNSIEPFSQNNNQLLIYYISPEMYETNDLHRVVGISTTSLKKQASYTEIQNMFIDIVRDQLIANTLSDNDYGIFSIESARLGKMMKEQGIEGLIYQVNHGNNPIPYFIHWFMKYQPEKLYLLYNAVVENSAIQTSNDFLKMVREQFPEEYRRIKELGEVNL
jgi:hypothetical protein